MDEILQKLVESELLNDDSKQEIKEAFEKKMEEVVKEAKEETEAKVRVELTEQFEEEKEQLIEAIDTKVEELLQKEIAELKEDIEDFRNLEADYADRLVEEKEKMGKVLQSDMAELIENLDQFVTECLQEEFAELEDDIKQVKQLEFGRQIFESIKEEFGRQFGNKDELSAQLQEAQSELDKVKNELSDATKSLTETARVQKMNEVLSDLTGRPREVMEAILKSFPTERLDEAYEKYITRVLHESSVEKGSEKENAHDASVLAEGKEENDDSVRVADGNGTEKLNESADADAANNISNSAEMARLRKLAGIN